MASETGIGDRATPADRAMPADGAGAAVRLGDGGTRESGWAVEFDRPDELKVFGPGGELRALIDRGDAGQRIRGSSSSSGSGPNGTAGGQSGKTIVEIATDDGERVGPELESRLGQRLSWFSLKSAVRPGRAKPSPDDWLATAIDGQLIIAHPGQSPRAVITPTEARTRLPLPMKAPQQWEIVAEDGERVGCRFDPEMSRMLQRYCI